MLLTNNKQIIESCVTVMLWSLLFVVNICISSSRNCKSHLWSTNYKWTWQGTFASHGNRKLPTGPTAYCIQHFLPFLYRNPPVLYGSVLIRVLLIPLPNIAFCYMLAPLYNLFARLSNLSTGTWVIGTPCHFYIYLQILNIGDFTRQS